jgi:hypothetical protein
MKKFWSSVFLFFCSAFLHPLPHSHTYPQDLNTSQQACPIYFYIFLFYLAYITKILKPNIFAI